MPINGGAICEFAMGDVIQVTQLTKHYPSVRAVDGIEFTVRRGEIFGFLGPNGAGKTTTIRMLTGLTRPTAGSARVLGFDLAGEVTQIKKRVGVVPESSNLYGELSAFENLIFSMQLYGVPRRERAPRAEELLSRFRLAEKRDTPFAKLSRGMKRALTVAVALAHRPSLLFLDEPTTGLDVMSARNLRGMIADLRVQGVTVFLTTHYLEEAERLCDRIAIIVRGRIVALDTVAGLEARVQERTAVEVTLEDGAGGLETRRFVAAEVADAARAALDQAQAEGRRVVDIHAVHPRLEDAFVQLTGLDADLMRVDKGARGR